VTVGVKPQGGELEDVSVDGEEEPVRIAAPSESTEAQEPPGVDAAEQTDAAGEESPENDSSQS
jgi:hypothetical protein